MKKLIKVGLRIKPTDLNEEEKENLYTMQLKECYAKRISEYPRIEDWFDAIAKGDKEAEQRIIEQQLAVKAKYPKPVKQL